LSAKLDPQAYDKDVVRPLRGAHDSLPGDLVTRYAIDVDMTADEVRARVAGVVALWNNKARGSGPIAAVYRAFQRAHDDLLRQPGVRLDDPGWWREQAGQWTSYLEDEVSVLVGEVRQLYGATGFVLPGHIAGLERLHPNLRGPGVRRALEKAGIPTVTPEELPQRSGIDRSAYERLTAALEEAGAATVIHLLHPGITEIRLFAGRAAPGARLPRLDRQVLERRVKAVETEANSARSRAGTVALGILRTAADKDADLHQLALFHILGKVRETRTAGQPPMLTIRSLVELGVAESDARVVTASLLALEGTSTTPSGPEDVRRLVAAGQLAAARQMAAALPAGDRDADAAREMVARADAEVEALLAAARAALAQGDEAEASRRAAAARNMATDDPAVAGFADSLPPPPPQGLVAVADGLDVKLSWQPMAGHLEAMRYRVVRRAGRAPIEERDGQTVTEGSATTARDQAPPVGEQLVYAVFATADRKRWSRPVTCVLEIIPPVTDVALNVVKDVVRCTWRQHPAATGVRVRARAGIPPAEPRDGRPVETSGPGFTDTGLTPETARCYAITAVYRDRSGHERSAEPVVVTALSHRELTPVASLTAEHLPGDGECLPWVRISWRQPDGASVRITRARSACSWPYGCIVPVRDVMSYGEEVRGELAVRDGRVELTAQVPWGRQFLTPFLFNGDMDMALVGQDIDLGLTTPIGAVSHERRGPELLLSWEWPARASAADLRWGRKPGEQRRITRGERSRDDGWARIPAHEGPMAVEIRAVEVTANGDVISGPRTVQLAAADVRLCYDISWKPALPGMMRQCEIRVSAPGGRHQVTIVAVAKAGVARPAHPADGHVLARERVSVSADRPAVFTVRYPGKFRKPYWLCCFLADGGHRVLIDPPIKHMKVG